jgi:hypothetical protein
MIGQDIRNAKRVVVLVEEEGGRQHGWEIFWPRSCSWTWTGLVAGSSHARMTVEGEFHRMSRQGIAEPTKGELDASQD